jgi:hypothetical protein
MSESGLEPGLLVSAGWLTEHATEPGLVILQL